MTAPIPCNCWLDDEPPCPSPCVFDDPSEEVDDCSLAVMLRDAGKPKTDCNHYREASSAAELTDEQLLLIAIEAMHADDIADAHAEGYPLELSAVDLLSVQRAAIAADRRIRPQPTPEALQEAYVEWFKAEQAITPSPTAARTAALFTLAVLVGEVEL